MNFCNNSRMDDERQCWICTNDHWVAGKLRPPVVSLQPEHVLHVEPELRARRKPPAMATDLEDLLHRSVKRPPGRETESANGSRPETRE